MKKLSSRLMLTVLAIVCFVASLWILWLYTFKEIPDFLLQVPNGKGVELFGVLAVPVSLLIFTVGSMSFGKAFAPVLNALYRALRSWEQ